MVSQREFEAHCRTNYSVFFQRAWRTIESAPYQHNWHVDCIAEHLQAVWDRDIQNIIINLPPRMLKTLLASVAFPAWGFIQDPGAKFMLTSFKTERARAMTRKSRKIVESPWYQQLAPHVRLAADQNQAQYFETTNHGHYYSAAMRSVTGEGCDIQICDDPISPDEASSPVQRAHTMDIITGTLFSRFNDPRTGRFILIMQRLGEDDPTGELLRTHNDWYHLKLPSEAKIKSFSYSARGKSWELSKGGLLFPERFTKEVLDKKKKELGAYNYAAQMLQEPVPLDGGEFKKDWVNYFNTKDFSPEASNIYIICDPASGKEDAVKNDLDYTCFAVWALAPDQNYYLIDGIKERLNPTERIDTLFKLHRKWNGKSGKPPKVGYEDIGMQSDTHYIKKKMNEENYRFHIESLPLKGKKRLGKIPKIRRLIAPMERGQIWLAEDLMYKDAKGLPRNFISDIVDEELLRFPFGAHDDFIDSMAMIFDMPHNFPKISNTDSSALGWGLELDDYNVLDM